MRIFRIAALLRLPPIRIEMEVRSKRMFLREVI